ncbi:FdhF/YdeP family oxidoreductase [Algibacter amylolyticus]|uniref:FdhF/YdeP family oxidoreductase n=1 Tax=Algibacter amylolyticus TaxID=1608400 RepID=A0A5M7B4Z4_9FLAO|nr:FdhF/YdeP family oxidoreductase [Algibacter amylolyticus]KAA5822351.1 FdhF/YdeP family oxidoreductase [Algibacter amylolyticus]MBB5269069.1 molybdopterin-dependent oxidoreductase alpha subunit [Algibacter amylolyticus]TSJ73501.1 FdhF/YdeP family oxidoreductase [Algibacter amylolyticus]
MSKSPIEKALTPEKFENLKTKTPPTNSVGFGALKASLGHANKYMKPLDALKVSLKMNQKGGFDCPGCAWPDPDDDRSAIGEYCENGLKAMAEEMQNKLINREFFAQNAVDDLASLSDFEIGKSGRLSEPMYLPKGASHYQPISWDDAFNKIAEHLNALDNPDEAAFYTSGRTTNEAAFLYQLFVREYGTSNLPDCSNMCHEASGSALSETLGIGKGSVTLDDLYKAEVVMVIGQNPATNHPRMLSALEKTKKNGGKIIAVNPLPEAGLIKFTDPQNPIKMLTGGTKLSDVFVPITINGDVAFFKALLLKLLEKEEAQGGVFDKAFINEFTSGYNDFISDLKTYNFETCLEASGVTFETFNEAFDLILNNDKIIICWAMGLTQHENAVDNIRELVNLLLLKGSIGIEGAGTCPVRGHSNVQGDRTVGIWEAAPQAFLDKIEDKYGFKPSVKHGYSVIESIKAMYEGKVKVFFGMGGNFISAVPDTKYSAQALANCNLTVHVSTKLNRSHLVTGQEALIFPCLGRAEKDYQKSGVQTQSVENSMGVVSSTKGILEPCSDDLLSEVAVVCGIAHATLKDRSKINWLAYKDDYNLVRDDIAEVVSGFEDYNKKLKQPSGFYLPNGARVRSFKTKTGKANFTSNKLPNWKLKDGELIMMTIRSHDQFNTTIYGLNDRYRGVFNERRIVFMNRDDMKLRSFDEHQVVNIKSEYNGVIREANQFKVVGYDIPKNCCATYFPETNVLVPLDSFAHTAKTPASKSVRVTITKV